MLKDKLKISVIIFPLNNIKQRMKKIFTILFIAGFIWFNPNAILAQESFKVVLDAGHGGTDPGNLGVKGHNYLEKDIVLKIALKVGDLLKKNKDIEVIYTRKDDSFIELFERGKIANKAEADLFISIHCDAFTQTSVNGAGTFVLGLHANKQNFELAKKENQVILLEDNYEQNYDGFDPNSPESVIGITLMQEEYLDQSLYLASLIQDKMVSKANRKDRKVKQAGFIVLHQTFMPSVLVETGFLTNKNEGAYLNSNKGQQEIANAIYQGIIAYKKQHDANTVVEVKPKPKKPIVKEEKPRVFEGVNFKVQIASSSKKVNTASYNFKGLKGVERIRIGAHHKYYYGATSDYNEVNKLKKQAQEKGYNSAFVVAFKNGKKVSVKSVLGAP